MAPVFECRRRRNTASASAGNGTNRAAALAPPADATACNGGTTDRPNRRESAGELIHGPAKSLDRSRYGPCAARGASYPKRSAPAQLRGKAIARRTLPNYQ
jgi:hypothetical protein